jgi:ATP-dependent DNA helicase RecQ
MSLFAVKPSVDDVEDTLFYLSRIESLKIEGGFLVTYNRLSIDRIEKNNRIKYKEGDHEKLNQHYHHKVQQIHIIGEYAKRMIQNYNEALQFVEDYFNLNYASFLNRYFPGSRQDEIKRSITPEKFRALFGALSTSQLKIIKDADNKYIVVAAGPGSGKTRVLVHKLASILLTEDVKHEQLLMLTFSRAAATEFKARLLGLIGSAANYVEIKTFHSYCFDLLGKVGSLPEADAVISTAVKKIRDNEIEISRITKNVLVIDEAQDISLDEYELIKGLIDRNEEMRVILVGDDDQNIFSFRGADAKFMQQLTVEKEKSVKYELIENFRSKSEIVAFANQWIHRLPQRLKHEPGVSMVQGKGIIEIVEHAGGSLLEPMADAAAQTGLSGTSCILTQTNEEAVQLKSLLILKGLDAKVIQSNDGFNLLNLYELRCFSDMLQLDDESPFISEETWAAAERQFDLEFSRSNKRELVQTVIRQFTSVNPVRKYKSDWKAFLVESKMEDFPNIDTETIYISTVHKAKGKEFDNVFILLDRRFNPASEENIRQLFVAATRAKTRLVIHYTGDYLRRIHVERLQYHGDPRSYSDPVQMAIVLTHRDVRLGYFAFVQRRINGMLSGDALTILEEGLGNSKNELVIKFSQRCKELMAEKLRNGYLLAEARVNFIVYWKDQEQVEVKIILPEVLLKKSFTQ